MSSGSRSSSRSAPTRLLRGARGRDRHDQRRQRRRGPARPRRGGTAFASWDALAATSRRCASGEEPPTPFVLAYRAVEAGDRDGSTSFSTATPTSSRSAGRTATTCSGWPAASTIVALLLERGADPNRGNDYGWTKLHQAGYSNDCELAQLMLDAGARTDLSARGDGGTPLVAALFWGHREVVDLLGREPGNLRVAAGLGDLDLIRELAGTPEAGAHRGFYRPHGGFPAWQPSDDPQEVLDEALVWAAKADRVDAIRAAGRARCARRRRSVPRHAARLGRGQRPRRADPRARRTRRRSEPARHVRRPGPRRGRHGAPPRGAIGPARGRRGAARRGRRPDDPRRPPRRAPLGLGRVRKPCPDRRALVLFLRFAFCVSPRHPLSGTGRPRTGDAFSAFGTEVMDMRMRGLSPKHHWSLFWSSRGSRAGAIILAAGFALSLLSSPG